MARTVCQRLKQHENKPRKCIRVTSELGFHESWKCNKAQGCSGLGSTCHVQASANEVSLKATCLV